MYLELRLLVFFPFTAIPDLYTHIHIQEIINASKLISTPIITAMLVNDKIERTARILKGRIEKTMLGGITEYIKEIYEPYECYLSVKLDLETISSLQLEINAESIRRSILATAKLKLKEKHVQVTARNKIRILPIESSREAMFYSLQQIKNALPKVIVSGISSVERAVINKFKDKKEEEHYNLLVEGYNLANVMATPGIKWQETKSNHIIEMQHTLGIEAARKTIISEIQYTMESHGMSIDARHVMLLADVMSYKGEVLGITRFGIGKMKDSVLMLASFEKTTDHLFDAAVHARKDSIEGVSECIIMGIPVPLGTGLFKIMKKNNIKASLPIRPPLLLKSAKMSLDINKQP